MSINTGAFMWYTEANIMKEHKKQEERPRIRIIAHRGGAGVFPENTMLAFSHAAQVGADALELDIHSTRDGELVVLHDPTVDRTTDGHGSVNRFSTAEIRRLDAGYRWTQDGVTYPFRCGRASIPLLRELFEAFDEYRMIIDIKQREPDITASFCRLIQEFDRAERTFVGSFHRQTLLRFRSLCPTVPTIALSGEVRRFLFRSKARLGGDPFMAAHLMSVPPRHGLLRVVDERFVRDAHAHGVEVEVWTVNEVDRARTLASCGVDGVVTDFPERMLAARAHNFNSN